MKKDILAVVFMTVICASVMFSIMGIFKVLAADLRNDIQENVKIESTVFKNPFQNMFKNPFKTTLY